MLSAAPSDVFAGRGTELEALRGLVREAAAGRGRVVWVEGEPGIGKSALVATGLAGAGASGCETAWCAADELSRMLPLRVMMRGLEQVSGARDGLRDISELLQGRQRGTGVLGGLDPVAAATERLLVLVDRLCASRPLVMVIDDLQWADDASLSACQQLALAVCQVPLLLVATCRPVPRPATVDKVRDCVSDRDGVTLALGPLPETEVYALLGELLGAPPGARLRQLAAHAAGNPLYLREIVAALQREQRLTVGPAVAELTESAGPQVPVSIASTLARRLAFLSHDALSMLGTAALLGSEFSARDLAAVVGRSPTEVVDALREAQAAGLTVESGSGLAFRHPLIRQALSERMPATLRAALHRHAAQALSEVDADVVRVAEQLLASGATDAWTLAWTGRQAAVLNRQSPQLGAELLSRSARHVAEDDPSWRPMWTALLEAQFRLGRLAEAEACARRLLARSTDPADAAEVGWLLARVLVSTGRSTEAVSVVERFLADPAVPALWRARMHALHTVFLRDVVGDLDGAEAAARDALTLGEQAADPFAIASAWCVRWTIAAVRRRYATALGYVDHALAALGDDTGHLELRASALEDKTFTLQNLDRLADADECLKQARSYALRTGDPRAALHVGAAVHDYWMGRWDDALAELDAVEPDSPQQSHFGLRERGSILLYHGVAALVAVSRDDRAAAERHLSAGVDMPLDTVSAWENADFLLLARALDGERRGELSKAVSLLAPILDTRPGQMTLVHQWLPELVRLAVAVGDTSTAQAASARCEAEAAREQVPARAATAALRCRGLLAADPDALHGAADHYRQVGRLVEFAQTQEELAALLGARGERTAARAALKQAADVYTSLDAQWYLHRAYTRMHRYGIRRGIRGRRGRAATGWDALTRTELAIAHLVGEGRSNPEIAAELFLSRGTVQCHVSHILTKLDARSRVEIAREAMAHRSPDGFRTEHSG